jgi:elongation factor G
MDRAGSSFKSSIESLLLHRLHPNPVAITLPISSFDVKDYTNGEPGIQGIIDLVNWNVWRWDEDGKPTMHPLPKNQGSLDNLDFLSPSHPLIPHLVPARTALLENLSMFSEDLMESLLAHPSDPSYFRVESKKIMKALRDATLKSNVLPVMCGSAMKNIGTEVTLDYAGELLASPLDVLPEPLPSSAPLRLLAWKVGWDKQKGWMTFVRIYSGTVFFCGHSETLLIMFRKIDAPELVA